MVNQKYQGPSQLKGKVMPDDRPKMKRGAQTPEVRVGGSQEREMPASYGSSSDAAKVRSAADRQAKKEMNRGRMP